MRIIIINQKIACFCNIIIIITQNFINKIIIKCFSMKITNFIVFLPIYFLSPKLSKDNLHQSSLFSAIKLFLITKCGIFLL